VSVEVTLLLVTPKGTKLTSELVPRYPHSSHLHLALIRPSTATRMSLSNTETLEVDVNKQPIRLF